MDLGPQDYQMIASMASFAMALAWIIYLHLVLVLGSFEGIILGQALEGKRLSQKRDAKEALSSIYSMQLCIAVVHGPSTHHIGARRQFYIENEDGTVIIRAHSIHTEQLVSWPRRRIVRRWIEERVDPRFQGSSESQHAQQSAQ